MTVHKEIYKKYPETDHTKISFGGQFKLQPHPNWSQLELFDEHPRDFYMTFIISHPDLTLFYTFPWPWEIWVRD